MFQTAIWIWLLLGTPKYNYFVTFDANRAYLVRSDTTVFWIRAGRALRVISGQSTNSPEGKLFDHDQWKSYNHEFWAEMLKMEGISVAPDENITLAYFQNALKNEGKNKDIYAKISKGTQLVLKFFSLNFPNVMASLTTEEGGSIVIINYGILAQTDRFYTAASAFMSIPEPSRGVISKTKAIAAFKKAMEDPDFASLMSGEMAAPAPTEGGEIEVETLVVKPETLKIQGEEGFLILEANQDVTIDSIVIEGFEGKFSVLDELPKTIHAGVDTISIAFTADVIDEVLATSMLNVKIYVENKSRPLFGIANIGTGEGAPPTEPVETEEEIPPAEGEEGMETITIEEEPSAGPSEGFFGTTLILTLLFLVLIALVVFLYMLSSKVNSIAARMDEFSNTAMGLRAELANLSEKLSELETTPAKQPPSELESSVQQTLTILQGIQLQIEGATNDIKESVESTGGRIKTEIIKSLNELQKSFNNAIQQLQRAASSMPAMRPTPPPERPAPPPTTHPTAPPSAPSAPPTIQRPAPPTPPERRPAAPTPTERPAPPKPTPPAEDRRRQELVRTMLASIAQKLRGLQESKMLKVVSLLRNIINAIPDVPKQQELQQRFQRLLELAEGWERIKNSVRLLRDAAAQPDRDLQELRMEFEALEATIEDISNALREAEATQKEEDFLPLIDAIEQYPQLKPHLREFMNLIGIEEIEVPVGKTLGEDVDQYEIWDVEGFGTRQVIVEVVVKGYRKSSTGEIIRKPRVKVRLE